MARSTNIVRLSSRGQVVLPAKLRRETSLKTGQLLRALPGKGRDIILRPAEDEESDLVEALAEARAWFRAWMRKTGRDPLKELELARRGEREREARRRERRGP